MDRALDRNERRVLRLQRLRWPVIAVVAVVGALVVSRALLRPTVPLSDLRTAEVQSGAIAATLAAEGRVVPASVEIVTSPIDSRVRRILLRPGTTVVAGETIVELDTLAAAAAVTGLDDRIALQQNAIEAAQLRLASALDDLDADMRIKELEITSLSFEVGRNETMVASGLISADVLRQSQTDLERAGIERDRLVDRAASERRQLEVELEGLEIEIGILQGQRREAAARLARASAGAERPGVVTAVLPVAGAAVRVGDELARVADLDSFRVEAEFADMHAQALVGGQRARIRAGGERLTGRIVRVLPAVENGAVRVEIVLDQPDHPVLRQNLRVEVEVVTDVHDQTLVVARGAVVAHDGARHLFVVRGDRLVRRRVELGFANRDSLEIRRGLAPGDRVVLSDMNAYARHQEVFLK